MTDFRSIEEKSFHILSIPNKKSEVRMNTETQHSGPGAVEAPRSHGQPQAWGPGMSDQWGVMSHRCIKIESLPLPVCKTRSPQLSNPLLQWNQREGHEKNRNKDRKQGQPPLYEEEVRAQNYHGMFCSEAGIHSRH